MTALSIFDQLKQPPRPVLPANQGKVRGQLDVTLAQRVGDEIGQRTREIEDAILRSKGVRVRVGLRARARMRVRVGVGWGGDEREGEGEDEGDGEGYGWG